MDAQRFLSPTDHEALTAHIRALEARTGAEFVVVIASASGRFERATSLVGVLTAVCGLAVVEVLAHAGGALVVPLWAQGVAVAVGFELGRVLARLVAPLRRMLVSDEELSSEVRRAALAAYAAHEVGETSHGAGVLLYLSLFERRLEVLLDSAAATAAGERLAGRLGEVASAALRSGRRREAIVAVLEEAARALEGRLPPRASAGELGDHVVIVHPHP